MAEDKVTETLLAALKQAQVEPGEQRLFKSGKLAGLFAGRQGVSGEAAARAVREGLLEVVRTETRGKISIDWVRPTPRSIHFVHDHESPLQTLKELRAALAASQAGVPQWLDEIRQELKTAGDRVAEQAERALRRLEALGDRVEEALLRLDMAPLLPNGSAEPLHWAADAITYLERRKTSGPTGDCSLPELFRAVAERHPGLSVPEFHDGLRRLQDRRALRLLPVTGPAGDLAQPEFALLEGGTVYYYAGR
jgi:hypothetical protein